MVKNPGQGRCNKLFSLGTIKYTDKAKPSLKIRKASAIFWDYLGMFRDYGQKIFF